MINKNNLVLAILLLVSLVSINFPVQAQSSVFDTSSSSLFSNEDEFLKPDQAFVFNFDQQGASLTLSFDIAEGYYLYKKQFKFTGEAVSFDPVALPTGIDHEDEFFGKQQIYKGPLRLTIPLKQVSTGGKIFIRYQGCAEAGLCFPPIIKTVELGEFNSTATSVLSALNQASQPTTLPLTTGKNANQGANKSEQYQLVEMLKGNNTFLTLIAFFIGGLLLSFTPCVFPMYPILTGIIVGQKDTLSTKKAFSLSFVYVQGMAITYTLLGIIVALAGAKFQAMFQHPIVLIVLSILFIFLALSMFGLFNLALPLSWQNKLNQLSNNQKGGSYFGVLAMGAISGLVASPCTTAPLTGALLYISQSGDIVLGGVALYALSLGMGLPLLILGSSGGKLLPKAGNWMNVIKNIFGLLLLAVPIFLLERFLPETFANILWIALLLGSASYFYVANQGTKANFWFGLRSLMIFLMMFYGANQAYQLIHSAPQTKVINSEHNKMFLIVGSLAELQQQVKQANSDGKTVMVDLYADWCIACKEFEKYTFPAPQVQQALSNTVLIQMDLTDMGSPETITMMKQFNIFGLPSILFFDLNGQELTEQRVTGFMGAEQFAAHINATF
ncbi:thiol:disulfide interchange protein DsbD [Thalassotalea insulae]|uniref:Thiol:disulfide interchange protein DsbD n=1 Tax=Thalassotalea insulae TaxID=2056778 RepID=A0ABQ6GSN7_9GAMM|nr:protein-disulfide reductase DsbD [Thalassotalea insulae]GLX78968.1 thiol:disulfide interchange protein DsbD [Thalassotalea insulae]